LARYEAWYPESVYAVYRNSRNLLKKKSLLKKHIAVCKKMNFVYTSIFKKIYEMLATERREIPSEMHSPIDLIISISPKKFQKFRL